MKIKDKMFNIIVLCFTSREYYAHSKTFTLISRHRYMPSIRFITFAMFYFESFLSGAGTIKDIGDGV